MYALTFVVTAFGAMAAALFWATSPAQAAAPTPACTAENRAALSLTKDASNVFTVSHGEGRLDEFIPLTYTGCRLTAAPAVKVLVAHLDSNIYEAVFTDYGDGTAFIHVTADAARLPDGSRTVRLVVSGPQVVTTVIPLTVEHQYRQQWLAIIFAVVGWAVGVLIAVAHSATAGDGDSPSWTEIAAVLARHWFAAILTVGAAYTAFLTAYLNNNTFTSGFGSLVGLAVKVGAASTAAAALTTTAGATANAARAKLQQRGGARAGAPAPDPATGTDTTAGSR